MYPSQLISGLVKLCLGLIQLSFVPKQMLDIGDGHVKNCKFPVKKSSVWW
jgi:hypothetical protein